MRHLRIHLVRNKRELSEVMNIRYKVFINEQKVPVNEEIDEYEKSSKQVIAYYNSKPAGCARIRSVNNKENQFLIF